MREKSRLIVVGAFIVLLGNLATALAPSMAVVLVARFITGAGGVMITVLGLTVVGLIFPAAQRVKWMGLYGMLVALCNVVGPMLGGILSDTIGWEWLFFLLIPLCVVGSAMILIYLPKLPVMDLGNKFDAAGVALFGAMLVGVIALCQLGGTTFPWLSLPTAGLALLVIVMLVLFITIEKRQGDRAMMPMNMFSFPIFTSSLICVVILTAASLAVYMFLALYMQMIMGLSATVSGIPITISSIIAIFFSPLLGQYVAKTGRIKSTIILCCILFALPNLYFSLMGPNGNAIIIYIISAFYGVGATIQTSIFMMAIQTGVPQERLGVATASIQTGTALGASIGMAVFTAVSNIGSLDFSIPWIFRVAAILSGVALLASLALKKGEKLEG